MIGAAMQRIAQRDGERCGECGRTIPLGESYTRQTCKQNGEFHVLVVCSTCHTPTARDRWLARLSRLLKRSC